MRVFTSNNHILCHLPLQIKATGPLKSYSCRPMERAIKTFSNLIKSHVKPGVNASNVLEHHLLYNKSSVKKINEEMFPVKPFLPDSFISNSSDNYSQLWEPFKYISLSGDT